MGKGIVYEIRRKCQVLAYNLTTPEFMSKRYYKIMLHKKLDLKNPKSFNEKLQWLKLNYWPKCNEAIECADKYLVREYLINKGYSQYVNELYGVWDNANDINWDELPEKFVLKCNHGCGFNLIVNAKSELDINKAKKQLNKWMKTDFAKYNAEPHYSKINRKIICEKHLGSEIKNYNFFCLNGNPEFVSVIEGLGAGTDEALTYYYANGKKAEFYNAHYPTSNEPLPETFSEMRRIASEIAASFPFVRVDFYEVEGKIMFSELTFTPGGALIEFTPQKYDIVLGERLNISKEMQLHK